MGIVKEVQYRGSTMTSTLNGNISLNEGSGELVVRNGANVLTRVNSAGFLYSEPSGTRRILNGAHPTDGHIGTWVSKPGVDVVDALEE